MLRLQAKFAENTGITTVNSAKPTQVGDLQGSTLPAWRDPPSPNGGSFLFFDGVVAGSVVRFPPDAGTTITGEISLAADVRTNQTFPGSPSTVRQREIITRGGGRLSLGWEQANVSPWIVWLRCYIQGPISNFELEWRDDDPGPGYRDNEWHNVVVRFRPSSAPGVPDGWAELWVDGVLKDGEAHDLASLDVSGVSDLWAIGGRVNTSSGAIDRNLLSDIQEVRLYDHYVADWEIEDMAKKTKDQLRTQITNLFQDAPSANISAADLRAESTDEVDSLAIEGIPARSVNEAQYRIVSPEEDLTALTGASVESIIAVPAGAELVGVGLIVTTAVTGATGIRVAYDQVEGRKPTVFRGALVQSNATQSVNAGQSAILNWQTEKYDTDGFHDNVTNNSRLTIPAGSGITKVIVSASFRGSTWGAGKVGVFKNGTIVDGGPELRVAATGLEGQFAVVSAPIECAEGDYFEARAVNDESSNKATVNDARTFMSIEVVEEQELTVAANVPVSLGSSIGTIVKTVPVTADTKLTLHAIGSNFTAGAVRLAIFYRTVVAPVAT